MRLLNIFTIAAFAIFVCGPLLSVLIFGYSKYAQKAPAWSTVNLSKLLEPDGKYRSTTAKNLVLNSPFSIMAIRAKSILDYRIFGFVNSSNVISGTGSWLFYKPQFDWQCDQGEMFETMLWHIEAMRVVARGANIDLRFSVSPDKSSVYADKLGGRAQSIAACKLQGSAKWRQIVRKVHSSVIDHWVALQESEYEAPLYYLTDTHWNELGQALALRQLILNFGGKDPGLPELGQKVETKRQTDMLRILRLAATEDAPEFPEFWSTKYKGKLIKNENTLILHDSFYHELRDKLLSIFENAEMIHVDQIDKNLIQRIASDTLERILVNSVERYFFDRLSSGALSWNSHFATMLINQNNKRSNCVYSRLPAAEMSVSNATLKGGSYHTKRDSQFSIRLPDRPGKTCFRARFETASTSDSEVFLPAHSKTTSSLYHPGYAVQFYPHKSQRRQISLVLPPEFSGRVLRFNPIHDANIIDHLNIEVGVVAN